MDHKKMTAGELALVLNIREGTIKKLAKTEQLPYHQQRKRMYFDFGEILNHLKLLEEGIIC